MDKNKLLQQFVQEAREHLKQVEALVLALEKDSGNVEIIHEIFQGIHGIKGGSDYVQLPGINSLSHEIETLLNRLRREKLAASPELTDLLLAGVDLIKDCIENVDDPDYRDADINDYIQQIGDAVAEGGTNAVNQPASVARDVKAELLDVFQTTANQHLETLEMVKTDLESGATLDSKLKLLQRSLKIFRNAATYIDAAGPAAALDNLLDRIELDKDRQEFLPHLVATIEQLRRDLEQLAAPHPGSGPESTAVMANSDAESVRDSEAAGTGTGESGSPGPADGDATLRVSMRKLDDFMNLVSDLVLIKNSVSHLMELAKEEKLSAKFSRGLAGVSNQVAKTSDGLQEQVMAIRMIPTNFLFERFPRMARDLARSHDKEVRLVMLGGDTEIDKGVAELLAEPLMHLIRNAIAHGIEGGDERTSAGKATIGTVTLKASSTGGTITIEVIDDGRGIDPARIAETARREKVLSAEEIDAMSETELVNLLFRPGFSTRMAADTLSGRGVGLDAVNSNVRKLGGNTQVEWEPGHGTRFKIRIPITLSVIDTIVVQAGDSMFAVPSSFVEENISVAPDRVSRLNHVRTILYDNHAVPLVPLESALGFPDERDDSKEHTTLIVRHGAGTYGLIVDRIVAQQDALVRPLDSQLSKLQHFSGATVMNDGRLVLILNPVGLIGDSARGAAA